MSGQGPPLAHQKHAHPVMHRHPEVAAVVGRMLLTFGEIETMAIDCVANVNGQREAVRKAFYRLRSTSSRLDAAEALAEPSFTKMGISLEYKATFAAIRYCQKLRNQYAHCNWADDQSPRNEGVFFVDLQEAAEATDGFPFFWKHVDVVILEKQEAHFLYAKDWLFYIFAESELRLQKSKQNFSLKPTERLPPPMHNPPSLHLPPWLDEDRKAQHLARALAAEGGAPTPTPAQLALEASREAKRARRQADRDRAATERSGKPPKE